MIKIFANLLVLASAFDPGADLSLDIDVVEQGKDVYWNYVMNILKNTKIPDTSFHGGYINDNTFTVTEAADQVSITDDSQLNGIKLSISSLQAQFKSGHFKYKKGIIDCKGSVQAEISQMHVDVTVGLTTQTLSNGKVVPGFTIPSVNVNLPKDKIKIKIHGNLCSQIADLFKSLFMGTIRDEITKTLTSTIKSELPATLNKLVSQSQGAALIYDGIDLDIQIPENPNITDKFIGLAIKGLIYPKNESEVEPSVQPVPMTYHNDQSASKLQVFLSSYVVDSAFYTYLKLNEVHFWTKPSDIPASFPVQLDTSSLNMFFPGMKDHYGPDLPVNIEYKLEQAENFLVRQNDDTMSFDADLGIKFWVQFPNNTQDLAVDVTAEDLVANFTILIEANNQIAMNITTAALKDIEVHSTTFGDLNLSLLAKLFNYTFEALIVAFNVWAKLQSITIPSVLFGIFTLSDLTLKYHDDYLEAGLTPTFLPPTMDVEGIYEQFVAPVLEEFEYDVLIEQETPDYQDIVIVQ